MIIKKIKTSRNIKVLLFAGIIAAMILPFSGMNVAEANETEGYEIMDIASALTAIEPYATINEDGSVTIDKSNIKQNLTKQDFKIAEDYLKHQNHLVKQLRDTPDKKPVSDEYSEKRFSKLVKHIKDTKSGEQISITETIGNMFVPKVYAVWGDVCGQSPWNVFPEPTAIPVTVTGQTAHNYLIGAGYHMVPHYASLTVDRDHAIEVNYLECNRGEMRIQGMINDPRDPSISNQYHSQGPEPNPEIFEYTAPSNGGMDMSWFGMVFTNHSFFY